MKGEKPTFVVDFDGTLSDVQKESESYTPVFLQALSREVGAPIGEIQELINTARNEVLSQHGFYGWEYNGFIVAPATGDPYVFISVCAKLTLEKLRTDPRGFQIPENVPAFLHMLFQESSKASCTAFREHAAYFLNELKKHARVVVVSNSETEKIKDKLEILLGKDHGIEVKGNARKFEIDPSWELVPESISMPGLLRPVYLRRRKYDTVLTDIGSVSAVIGDMYELDLALPEAKGITTVLITSDMTPVWEADHYEDHPNGFASSSLRDASQWLLDQKVFSNNYISTQLDG